MSEQKLALGGLLVASLIWAISGLSFKIFLDYGFPIAIILWVGILFRFTSVWLIADFKKLKHEWVKDRRELKFAILNGLFSLGTPIFFILALTKTSLSNTYFVAYTAPAWVMILAMIFLGEKMTGKKILGLGLTMVGIFLVANPGDLSSIDLGILYAFAAALSFACDIVTGRELKDYPYHTVSIYSNAVQLSVLTFMVFFYFDTPQVPVELPILGFVAMAVLGLFRGVASEMYYYALEKLEASTASSISLAELIFASILAFIVLGEAPKPVELIGYSFIIVAAFIIILRTSDIEYFEYLLRLRRKH